MRRRRNLLDKLLINGSKVTDIKAIKRHIISFYRNLYRKQVGTSFDVLDLGLQKISDEEAVNLEKPVTRQEVYEVLISCDPSKAPGYDGFNMRCIRKMWPIVGEDFVTYIINFFETGKLHPSFNTTWVTLIPKKEGVLEVKDLRPTSLVGSPIR